VNFRRSPLGIRQNGFERAQGYGVRDRVFEEAEKTINSSVVWLKDTAVKLEKPWTLSINIGPPHFPHFVTQELWDMYPDGGDMPEFGSECLSANHPYARDLRDHFQMDTFSEKDIRGLRRGYLGCVTYVDRQIGRLLDTLEETGQLEDTVFVYTSDHGEMLGKFGMWWKCSMYEDSVRIPMIVAGPGFQCGAKVKTPVSLFDLQATIFKSVEKIRPFVLCEMKDELRRFCVPEVETERSFEHERKQVEILDNR
jgi:choline-sulfatase